jgi:hypothetical protein
VLAVPLGSTVSEQGTVYVADAEDDDADRTDGPVMAGHVGARVRFTGPEVVLGGAAAGPRHAPGLRSRRHPRPAGQP